MIRLLYCTDSLVAGGTEHQLVELVTRLDRQKFEPHVLCLYGQRANRSLHFEPHLLAAGIPVYHLDLEFSVKDKLRAIVEIVRIAKQIRPDIIHAVNYHSNLLTRLAYPLLWTKMRLINSVYVEYTRKQLLYERLSSWVCDAVVCNSPHLRQQLIGAIASRRLVLIPNGIDRSRFSPLAAENDLVPSAARVVLMIGRVSCQKAPHLLVEAIGKLKESERLSPSVRVIIVGEAEDHDEQQRVSAAVQRYGLGDVITQLSATAQPERFYPRAHVTVLPSLWEGLPNVMLESLAAGTPVIVSEAANAAGVIVSGVNGWTVRTGDAAHLAERLADVLNLPEEQVASMRLACTASTQTFDVSRMVTAYQTFYEHVSARS